MVEGRKVEVQTLKWTEK